MKPSRWPWLIVICLIAVLLVGCAGISQSEHEALQEKCEVLQTELDEIKEVYPPRDFSSLSELEDWLRTNNVSEELITAYGEDWFRKALRIQEDALRDGYIISADYDIVSEEGDMAVWCTTVVNGRLFIWDPETDEVYEEHLLGTVK